MIAIYIDIKGTYEFPMTWMVHDFHHFDIAEEAMSSLAPQDSSFSCGKAMQYFFFLGGSSRTPLGKQYGEILSEILWETMGYIIT